jgi:hypothetical protein
VIGRDRRTKTRTLIATFYRGDELEEDLRLQRLDFAGIDPAPPHWLPEELWEERHRAAVREHDAAREVIEALPADETLSHRELRHLESLEYLVVEGHVWWETWSNPEVGYETDCGFEVERVLRQKLMPEAAGAAARGLAFLSLRRRSRVT